MALLTQAHAGWRHRLSALTLIMIALTALLLSACSSLFFYPDQRVRLTPDKLGLRYEDIYLDTRDNTRIHAWRLIPEQTPKGVIVVLHGNAENISSHIISVSWLVEAGYELLLPDYRGFGQSAGKASLPGIFQDLDAVSQWLEERRQQQNIPIFWLGQSIGANLSYYYLATHPVVGLNAVILDAPFASYRRLAREKLGQFWLTWPFQYPASWLIDDRFSPIRYTDHWQGLPLLIYASDNDRVIPMHHTKRLVKELERDTRTPLKVIETHGAHISTYRYPEYRIATLEFLSENR